MKSGKSRKNSTVPSSAKIEKLASPKTPLKGKSANVIARAAKAVVKAVKSAAKGNGDVKAKKGTVTSVAKSQKTKAEPALKGAKQKETVGVMPAPIMKSAMKQAGSKPGISPEAIPTKGLSKISRNVSRSASPGKELGSAKTAGVKVKAVSSRRTPKAGAQVEAVRKVEPKIEIPAPVASTATARIATTTPVVRPSVGSPPPPVSESKARMVRQPRPVPVEIPPILLEPDHVPTEPAIAGPGARFALTPPMEHALRGAPEELPESYGTEQIFLAARDPYCLFASWDLDARQRARYNAASASGAVTIRLRRGSVDGAIELEVHSLPTSRDQFIEVKQPDTTFVAELGYHEKNSGAWRRISVSKTATTPRDRMAPMIAPEIAPPVEAVVAPRSEPEPQAQRAAQQQGAFQPQPRREEIVFALQEPWVARQESSRETPRWKPPAEQPRWKPSPSPATTKGMKSIPAPKWSAAKTRALAELISLEFRRMQQGSLEIEEVLRRRILHAAETEETPSSIELAEEWEAEEFVSKELGLAQPTPSSLELAERLGAPNKGFWFKVNAELIIYGSTEPDAHVSIGGRPIRLRADGTFSYRFVLPDGAYELPVMAIAQDRHDGRAAELRFSRATQYSGDVGAHPQDPALKPPSPANL